VVPGAPSPTTCVRVGTLLRQASEQLRKHCQTHCEPKWRRVCTISPARLSIDHSRNSRHTDFVAMPSTPLVSVGVPTYSRPEGLRRALRALTEQTYENLEIIVSDNASPGTETSDVVGEFSA